MSASGINGQAIQVGDSITVVGLVVSTTGVGQQAFVTVETSWSPSTFVAQGWDMRSVQHGNNLAQRLALSISGKIFGAPQDQVAVLLENVTSISGSGKTAQVTGTLVTSGSSVTVPAGACASASAVGGAQ